MSGARAPDAILVGDLQSTLLIERLVGREDNRAARARVLHALARIEARTVVFLGDLVARQSAQNWAGLDVCLAALRARGVRIAAAVGNHDLWLIPGRGYRALAARGLIPAEAPWQRLDVGNVRVFLLDSNRWALGGKRWQAQVRWLEAELDLAERDTTVRAALVVSHHPPWTNSRVANDSEARLAPFLRAFHRCAKAQVWLSGHVHAYERFAVRGKTLVVSGSGGAPRMRLRTGPRARHVDLAGIGAPSPFGWLELSVRAATATRALRGFRGEDVPWRVFDELSF